MKKYVVKFFGSTEEREQIKLVKYLVVSANNNSEIEDVLRHKYGYKVINGLKIRQYEAVSNDDN